MRLEDDWNVVVVAAFSDGGWATRISGHSQAGHVVLLCQKSVVEGTTARSVVLDYSSAKITLSVRSSFDAEPMLVT